MLPSLSRCVLRVARPVAAARAGILSRCAHRVVSATDYEKYGYYQHPQEDLSALPRPHHIEIGEYRTELELLEEEPALREKLWENVHFFRRGIENLGFTISESETPIIPLLVGDASLTMQMGEMLFKKGVFMQGIRPPAVPQGSSRLRITIMATHTVEQMEYALDALGAVGKQLGII